MDFPVTGIAQRHAVRRLEPQFGMRLKRLEVMRVKLDARSTAVLARRAVSRNHLVSPLLMRAATTAAPCVRVVPRMLGASVAKAVLVSTRLRAELSSAERRNVKRRLAPHLSTAPKTLLDANRIRHPTPMLLASNRLAVRRVTRMPAKLKLYLSRMRGNSVKAFFTPMTLDFQLSNQWLMSFYSTSAARFIQAG